MSDLFDRALILAALDKLDSELARRSVRADMFVVGGAAIALAYSAEKRTRDVDAVFAEAGTVYEAARAVARRLGLPADWLNDAVRTYLIGEDREARVIVERPHLRVSVGSPPYVLAMKLLAARVEQDRDDIRLLYGSCGYTTAADGIRLLNEMLPGRTLPPATIDLLEVMFGPLAQAPDWPTGLTSTSRPSSAGPARCEVCGRPLRAPSSIAAGVGPTCARKRSSY